ncbi:MAG: DUF1150 domain-containing protein [Hyphomicrobiaceae bacterium]|nr:DUF1150 domain-containing protein [Hyphomicrobiaceae bacterium]
MVSNSEVKMISAADLAELGDGQVAYIRTMTSDEAHRLFPAVNGLPEGINLYALHAANGRPIALTDTMQAALGHALEDELQIASIH